MQKITRYLLVLATTMTIPLSFDALGTVITTGCTADPVCTVVEMDSSGTISVDELFFERAGSTFISSGGAESVSPNENNVTVAGNDSTSGMPTLNWDDNGEHFANDGDNQTYSFITYTFDVTIAAGFEIYGTKVILTPYIYTTDGALIEAILTLGGFSNSVAIAGNAADGATDPVDPDQNTISFSPLTGTVAARLYLSSTLPGSDGSDVGFIETVDTIFNVRRTVEGQVPIPTTLALFGLGLAGLGWSRRRKL